MYEIGEKMEEKIKNIVDNAMENLEKYIQRLKRDEDEFQDVYKKDIQRYRVGVAGFPDVNTYEDLKEKNCEYVESDLKFLHELKDAYQNKEKINFYFQNLLERCLESIANKYNQLTGYDFLNLFSTPSIKEEYSALTVLKDFADVEENVVLIGGNGTGKTTLANCIKGNDQEVISVIPAQKTLCYSVDELSTMQASNRETVEDSLLNNGLLKMNKYNHCIFSKFQRFQFTQMVGTMHNEYFEYLRECQEKDIKASRFGGLYGTCIKIFYTLFPEIRLRMTSDLDNYLMCIKDGNQYTINEMSEGEKAALYYIMCVLLSKDGGIIIVDEPETHLNPSLTSRLWDLLIAEKAKCQFIFVTHSIDFLLSRHGSKIAWIKEFNYPFNWKIQFLEDDMDIPKAMLTEILGTNRPLIFCEGDDKSSKDYQIYQGILGKSYTIIPVKGHNKVINYTRVMNDNRLLNYKVYGIVDGDNWSEKAIQSYKQDNIFVLPFNEIEMFLLCDELLVYFMKKVYMDDYKQRIEDFKREFWELFDEKKEKVILNAVKSQLEEYLSHEKICQYHSKDEISKELLKYNERLDEVEEAKIIQINKIIEERNYRDLLKVCNLKKEVLPGLTNKKLDSNYYEKIMQSIKCDPELQLELQNSYFRFGEMDE